MSTEEVPKVGENHDDPIMTMTMKIKLLMTILNQTRRMTNLVKKTRRTVKIVAKSLTKAI